MGHVGFGIWVRLDADEGEHMERDRALGGKVC